MNYNATEMSQNMSKTIKDSRSDNSGVGVKNCQNCQWNDCRKIMTLETEGG